MTTVLVIDDEMDLNSAVCAVLADEGYRVVTAPDGRAGIEQARAVRPDVVLMDVMMPVLSGLEALQVLKADPDTAAIPVILMSAVPPRPEFGRLPMAAFLKKPFTITSLLTSVASLAAPRPDS